MQMSTLDYSDGAVRLSGRLFRDDERAGTRPGIVLFPDARGIGEHVIDRARRLGALDAAYLRTCRLPLPASADVNTDTAEQPLRTWSRPCCPGCGCLDYVAIFGNTRACNRCDATWQAPD